MKTNFYGSEEIKVSIAGENIIPEFENWSYAPVRFKEISLMNTEDCSVQINESEPIFLRALQGFHFRSGNNTEYIDSIVFLESGIEYQILGRY